MFAVVDQITAKLDKEFEDNGQSQLQRIRVHSYVRHICLLCVLRNAAMSYNRFFHAGLILGFFVGRIGANLETLFVLFLRFMVRNRIQLRSI